MTRGILHAFVLVLSLLAHFTVDVWTSHLSSTPYSSVVAAALEKAELDMAYRGFLSEHPQAGTPSCPSLRPSFTTSNP